MSSLDYSVSALSVLNKFHHCDMLIYVEGDSDVRAWEIIFGKFSEKRVKIEPKHGCEELDKLEPPIIDGSLNAIIIRDADYHRVSKDSINHHKILYTAGHSIENTIFCGELISKIINSWSRRTVINANDCNQWLNITAEKFREAVILEIANYLSSAGVAILGDNCTRFMRSQTSAEVDTQKLEAFIAKKRSELDDQQIEIAQEMIDSFDGRIVDLIRGHFLQNAIMKYIADISGNQRHGIKISADALFSQALVAFEQTFEIGHPHYDYYQPAITEALN